MFLFHSVFSHLAVKTKKNVFVSICFKRFGSETKTKCFCFTALHCTFFGPVGIPYFTSKVMSGDVTAVQECREIISLSYIQMPAVQHSLMNTPASLRHELCSELGKTQFSTQIKKTNQRTHGYILASRVYQHFSLACKHFAVWLNRLIEDTKSMVACVGCGFRPYFYTTGSALA